MRARFCFSPLASRRVWHYVTPHETDGPNHSPFRNLLSEYGAVAQLGERLNGIQEVGGSIPPGSTRSSF